LAGVILLATRPERAYKIRDRNASGVRKNLINSGQFREVSKVGEILDCETLTGCSLEYLVSKVNRNSLTLQSTKSGYCTW
jgi:hypothetical protein